MPNARYTLSDSDGNVLATLKIDNLSAWVASKVADLAVGESFVLDGISGTVTRLSDDTADTDAYEDEADTRAAEREEWQAHGDDYRDERTYLTRDRRGRPFRPTCNDAGERCLDD